MRPSLRIDRVADYQIRQDAKTLYRDNDYAIASPGALPQRRLPAVILLYQRERKINRCPNRR